MNVPTCAVLAGGLDKIFPSVHKKYTEEMLADGGILSENIPGTRLEAHLFPHRNRIIAGMADAVIVVEASDRGGALITAQQADSYHKTMFAVPGELGKKYSYGTNKLIAKQQALIYTGIEDVMYHMNWLHSNEELKESTTQLPNLEGDEKKYMKHYMNIKSLWK